MDEKENIIYGGYVEILFHLSNFQLMNIQSPKCNMGWGDYHAPLLKISNWERMKLTKFRSVGMFG
jgi:hypothetical protein